jgi:RNase P subunit RPR2
LVDNILPITSSTEEKINFAKAIAVKSRLEVYRDIESARCSCGGKFFPSGPINLKSPKGSSEKINYQLMIAYCTTCGIEENRIYAIDTSTKEYRREQAKGFKSNPRWGRLVGGNPIEID